MIFVTFLNENELPWYSNFNRIKNNFVTSGLLLKSGIVWYTHINEKTGVKSVLS